MSALPRDRSREPGLRELLSPPVPHRPKRRYFWYAVLGIALVVVVLLALIGLGVLVPAGGASPAPVTVSYVHWTVLQGDVGNNSSEGWFGPSEVNYTKAEGYPHPVASGGTFTVSWVVSNAGGAAHTVYSATVAPPYSLLSTRPSLPVVVPAGEDTAIFTFTVRAPSDPGASIPLSITVDALPP